MSRSVIFAIVLAAIAISAVSLFVGPPDETTADTVSRSGDAAVSGDVPSDADGGGGILENAARAVTDLFAPDTRTPEASPEAGSHAVGDQVSQPVEAATGLGAEEDGEETDIADTMGPAANEALEPVQDGGADAKADGIVEPDPEAAADAATDMEEDGEVALEGDGTDDLASTLSTGGFDYARAVEAVEAADLSGLRERSARDALEEARDDPEAREAALARVRRLLGIE